MSIKAFDLVPVIERVKLMSDKAKTQIECLDVCGKNLYIGTNDCFVVQYSLEEKSGHGGKIVFYTNKIGHKYLALKKPINQIKAAAGINRILVLCDHNLTLLNMFDLEPIVTGAKIKGVTAFCINDSPARSNPFNIEICIAAKKKYIQIFTISEDKISSVREISLPEPALALGMDDIFVCVALSTQYCMVDFDSGHVQDLFPYDNEHTRGLVKRINKEEFLLSGPNALGMFVTSAGISQRPPLQWSENLLEISFVHPYIVALNSQFITVHSILDQQQKQAIPFQGGVYLDEFDGKLFVASCREIYSLVPVAWEKQIQALLADKRVTEALDLAKNSNRTGLSKDKFLKIFRRIQQQAGFIEFAERNFEEAKELFQEGLIDPSEVISLYPKLMPSSSNFHRAVPPLHDIADINQLAKGNEALVQDYKQFLRFYLEEIRGTKLAAGCKQEIDVALLKLYAEVNSPELIPLIAVDSGCGLKDSVEWLDKYGRYHALALLYKFHGENDNAVQIWVRLLNGEIEDDIFPGLEFLVEYLANLSDHEVIWKYVDSVLEKDQELGVKIFTERPSNEPQTEKMRPDTVLDYLSKFPKSIIVYLEYLVFQKKLEKEKYHTHLAVLYMDNVLQLLKNNSVKKEEIDISRSKLRHMLQISRLYRVQLVLGKAKETDMHAECAIMYGKLEEHDKALRILVHKLKDFGAAENYCLINSQGKDPLYRKRLFHILLSVYLDPAYERKDTLVAPAVALLNSNVADFDTVKVLQLLPDAWSVGLVSQFLSRAIRRSMSFSRTSRIERMMARGENLQVKQHCIEEQKTPVIMNEDSLCSVCNRAFSDPTFSRYPNGIRTHVHCAKNRQICPVTGKMFDTKKS